MQDRFQLICLMQWVFIERLLGQGTRPDEQLIGIMIRLREGPVAFAGDIRKMYHAIKMSLIDQHTHRFRWREEVDSGEPTTYVMTSVSFGDKPAGYIATTALRKTVEMMKDEFPNASQIILNNTNVDDIVDSVQDTSSALKVHARLEVEKKQPYICPIKNSKWRLNFKMAVNGRSSQI